MRFYSRLVDDDNLYNIYDLNYIFNWDLEIFRFRNLEIMS